MDTPEIFIPEESLGVPSKLVMIVAIKSGVGKFSVPFSIAAS
jgi:hypothetical protein